MKSIITFIMNELLQKKLLALRYDKDNTIDLVIKEAEDKEISRDIELLDFFKEKFNKDDSSEKVVEEFRKSKSIKNSEKMPCNFDHNGECLICDCWPSECAFNRLLNRDFKWESEEELKKMFKDYIV